MQLMNGSDIVFIALGSNLTTQGRPSSQIVNAAIDRITSAGYRLMTKSPLFETPAFPAGSGPNYINAVAAYESDQKASDILVDLHKIEADFDRQREVRWAPRSLDLDLLLFGDRVLPNTTIWHHWAGLDDQAAQTQAPEELILPHPRLHKRAFVLAPLREIAALWRHPVLDETVEDFWNQLDLADRAEVRRIN